MCFALFLGEPEQALATLAFGLWGDNEGDVEGFCAGAFGITEHMELGNVQTLDEAIGVFKILIALTACAHNNVYTDEGIGHHGLDFLHLGTKECSVVATAHQGQYIVAAALQGDVEVRHEGTALCAVFDDFVREQVGLYARNAIAVDALHSVEGLHELEKGFTRGASEVADVHTGQYDFSATCRCGFFGLPHQVGYGRVARQAACCRYSAVGAEIVASVLYFEKIACTLTSRAGGNESLDVFEWGVVEDTTVRGRVGTGAHLSGLQMLFNEFYDSPFRLLSDHKVYTLHFSNVFTGELCVASHHSNESTGMFAVQAVDGMATFGIGLARYAAGVDNGDVSALVFLGRSTSSCGKSVAQG